MHTSGNSLVLRAEFLAAMSSSRSDDVTQSVCVFVVKKPKNFKTLIYSLKKYIEGIADTG